MVRGARLMREEDDDDEDDEAGVDTTKIVAKLKKLKAEKAAFKDENAALKAAPSSSSKTRAKYDHTATKARLIDNTSSVYVAMEKLTDDYDSVYYIWAVCEYWKSHHKMTDPSNRAKKNAHDAFLKYFKKYQHLHGLPETGSASSTSASSAPASPFT